MAYTTQFSAHINKHNPYSKEPLNYLNMICHNKRLNTDKSKHIRKELSDNNIVLNFANKYFRETTLNGVSYIDDTEYFKRVDELYYKKHKKSMSKLVNKYHEIILNLSHNTTKDQLVEFGLYLNSIGYTILDCSYHADELDENIEIDKEGKYKEYINYHAHYIVTPLTICLENGKETYKNINKSLTRGVLKSIQDTGAKIFGMERGMKGSKTKNIPSAHLRALKRVEVALDNELFKNLSNKLENIDKIGDIDKIVKDYISTLYNDNKSQMMELKATKDDYRVSDSDMKEFKNVMTTIIKSMKTMYKAKKGIVVDTEFKELLKNIAEATLCLQTKQKAQIEQLKSTINTLKQNNNDLLKSNEAQKTRINTLEQNNKAHATQIEQLKDKITTLQQNNKNLESSNQTQIEQSKSTINNTTGSRYQPPGPELQRIMDFNEKRNSQNISTDNNVTSRAQEQQPRETRKRYATDLSDFFSKAMNHINVDTTESDPENDIENIIKTQVAEIYHSNKNINANDNINSNNTERTANETQINQLKSTIYNLERNNRELEESNTKLKADNEESSKTNKELTIKVSSLRQAVYGYKRKNIILTRENKQLKNSSIMAINTLERINKNLDVFEISYNEDIYNISQGNYNKDKLLSVKEKLINAKDHFIDVVTQNTLKILPIKEKKKAIRDYRIVRGIPQILNDMVKATCKRLSGMFDFYKPNSIDIKQIDDNIKQIDEAERKLKEHSPSYDMDMF